MANDDDLELLDLLIERAVECDLQYAHEREFIPSGERTTQVTVRALAAAVAGGRALGLREAAGLLEMRRES